jgi:hypothetical protein
MVVAALLAASLLVVAVLAAQPADAASRFKTVTRTFSNDFPTTIPSGPGVATPYPSDINVSGFRQGKIIDVSLSLNNYSHDFPDDVAVLLEGPRGQDAIVMSDVGFDLDVNNIALVLDDEATGKLPDETQITSGTFKPTQGTAPARFPPYGGALSFFDGTNPNGTWSLFAYDDTNPDRGVFAGGWSITIKARVPR